MKIRTKEAYCPVNGWDWPYYRTGGKCAIDEPIEECDDYMYFFYDEYMETGLNPYTDEERMIHMKKDKLFSIYGRCCRKIETREELYQWIEYAERMLKKYGWEHRKVFPYTTAENSIDIVNYVKDYDNCTIGSKRYLMTFANRFGDILEAWIDIEERKRKND